jgi:hypothetical protein
MVFPKIDKFLFCLSLQTGGTILAWFSVLFYGLLNALFCLGVYLGWLLSAVLYPPGTQRDFFTDLLTTKSGWAVITFAVFFLSMTIVGMLMIGAVRKVSSTRKLRREAFSSLYIIKQFQLLSCVSLSFIDFSAPQPFFLVSTNVNKS